MLTKRINNMTPSATVELSAKIEELRRQGVDVIAFNIGEPDFDTPENVKEEGHLAIDQGYTKYTEVAGRYELREAICKKLKTDNNVEYKPNEIIVSTGAKQSLFNAVLTICQSGDEVILPSPYWVSYIEMVKIAEATPIVVPMREENGFRLDVDEIEKVVTDKTKAIIMNTPNNPTGTVYSEEAIRKLGELAVKSDFYIISDEIYEKLIYDGAKHVSIASLSPEIQEKTITVNGFAKAYAMTGWRLGYAAGPRKIIKAMTSLQGHMTSGANSISQKAAVEALVGSHESIEYMREKFDKRRKFLVKRLREMKGVSCADAKGAFYLMPNLTSYYGKAYDGRTIKDSGDMANFLLKEAHIAVVPGSAFGSPDNIRVTYANSLENIKAGMDRMEKALSLLK